MPLDSVLEEPRAVGQGALTPLRERAATLVFHESVARPKSVRGLLKGLPQVVTHGKHLYRRGPDFCRFDNLWFGRVTENNELSRLGMADESRWTAGQPVRTRHLDGEYVACVQLRHLDINCQRVQGRAQGVCQ